MAITGDPPFERGRTGGYTSATDGEHLVGREYWFPDVNWNASTPTKPLRSNRWVKCRIVRNQLGASSSGAAAAKPKRLVCLASDVNSAGHWVNSGVGTGTAGVGQTSIVSSYARTANAPCYPVDEFLPAGGAAYNDLFYIVVRGPAMCMTALSTMTAIDVGDYLTNLTAATSGATDGLTTSGKLDQMVATSETLPDLVLSCIGKALSAATSQQYSADILVDVGIWG